MANWWTRLGRKAARAPLARGALAYLCGWDGMGDAWNGYEQAVRDGFLRNPVASRAVRLISEGAASAPLYLRLAHDRGEALIGRPSPMQTMPAFIEALTAHLILHGNAYVETVPDETGQPAELHLLRPERITAECDARGWVCAYAYRVGNSVTRFPAGPGGLLHLRAFHPLDDHYGAGNLEAAAQAIATHNAAARWNRALLDNAARPSGALVFEGETLSAEQFERLKQEMETGFAGAANAGRPMLLEGGLKWQPLSLSPADMDFAGSHAAAARDIALAFGVPPMLLGLPGDNTYANYREANRALWRLTILPLLMRVTAALSQHLGWWWPGFAIDVDLDAIPALSEDRERLWAQLSVADFLSADEKRAMVGLEPQR